MYKKYTFEEYLHAFEKNLKPYNNLGWYKCDTCYKTLNLDKPNNHVFLNSTIITLKWLWFCDETCTNIYLLLKTFK